MKNFTKVGLGLSLVLANCLYAADIPNDFVIKADTNLAQYEGSEYNKSTEAFKITKPKEQRHVTLEANPTDPNSPLNTIFVNHTDTTTKNLNGNEFTMKGGELKYVFAAYVDDGAGESAGNTLNLEGGKITFEAEALNIYGGIGVNAKNNIVNIKDGFSSFAKAGIGAVNFESGRTTKNNTANNNVVNIDGGDFTDATPIYAVNLFKSENSTAKDNAINLNVSDKNWDELDLYVARGLGRNPDLGIQQTFSGNTLNISGKGNTLNSIQEFENLNFYLPKDTANGETILKLTTNQALNLANVGVGVGIIDGATLAKDESVNLIDMTNPDANAKIDNFNKSKSSTLTEIPQSLKQTFTAIGGLSSVYKFEIDTSSDDKKLIAKVIDDGKGTPAYIPNDFVIKADTDLSQYEGSEYNKFSRRIHITKPLEKRHLTLEANPIEVDSPLESIIVNSTDTATKNLSDNKFTMKGGELSEVYATYVNKGTGESAGNTLNLEGGKIIDKAAALFVYDSTGINANNNIVNIKGNFSSDYVYMTGVEFGFNLSNNKATNNIVNIDGGNFENAISNIFISAVDLSDSKDSTATNNVLNLNVNDKNWDKLDLYAADGRGRTNAALGQTFSGNTLNIKGKGNTLNSIQGFENLNFYLPKDIKNGDTIINLKTSKETNLENVKIGVGIVDNPTNLKASDTFTLLQTTGGLKLNSDIKKDYTFAAITGLSSVKEFQVAEVTTNSLTAKLKDNGNNDQSGSQGNEQGGSGSGSQGNEQGGGSSSGENQGGQGQGNENQGGSGSGSQGNEQGGGSGEQGGGSSSGENQGGQGQGNENQGGSGSGSQGNEQGGNDQMQVAKKLLKSQQKNLLETGVAVINVLSNSNDALEGVNLTSVVNSGSTLGNDIAMFSNVSASKTRLNSGSHVDSKGFSGVIGVAKGINEIMNLGAFVELGGGDYDSFNDFNIKGNGKIKYAGIGAIAQFDFANDAYLKANLKVGRVSSDYKGSLQGKNLEYDIDRTYFGAGILGGKVFELSEALNLDAYAGLGYSSIGSKNVKIWNETVQFDKINSIKSKVGARLSYNLNESFAMFGGVAHEYEFDGKAKGRIVGKDEIKAPSLKGGTSIGEIGVKMSSGGFTSELLLKGLTGKKEGVNLGVNVKYEF